MCRPSVMAAFEGDNRLSHLLTYGGHAAACAAALANLAIIEDEGLVENAARMGRLLMDGLEALRSHPTVGDVRGLGLLAGVELVKDKATKAKFEESGEELKALTEGLQNRGLLTRSSDVISLSPPLCITEAEVCRIVEITDAAITEMEQRFGYA